MISTHLCQVLGFVAMEPPVHLDPTALRNEKAKVFAAMRPLDPKRVMFGQYDGYRDEEGVAEDSEVETFVALEAFVDTERWQGVPFYLRTGKALGATRRTVTLTFRTPPRGRFGEQRLPAKPIDARVDRLAGISASPSTPSGPDRMDLLPLQLQLDVWRGRPRRHPSGSLRAAAARRDARRPDAVHPRRRGGPAVADMPAGARLSAAVTSYARGSWGPDEALPGGSGRVAAAR